MNVNQGGPTKHPTSQESNSETPRSCRSSQGARPTSSETDTSRTKARTQTSTWKSEGCTGRTGRSGETRRYVSIEGEDENARAQVRSTSGAEENSQRTQMDVTDVQYTPPEPPPPLISPPERPCDETKWRNDARSSSARVESTGEPSEPGGETAIPGHRQRYQECPEGDTNGGGSMNAPCRDTGLGCHSGEQDGSGAVKTMAAAPKIDGIRHGSEGNDSDVETDASRKRAVWTSRRRREV
jgi:hypothetical protein